MPKIIHCPAQCIGCLACTSVAPEHFAPDTENGKAKLIGGQADGECFTKEVSEVPELLSEICPAGAIQIKNQKKAALTTNSQKTHQ